VIRVADFAHLASNGMITNEKTLADDPALARRMVQAVTRGIAYTLANPDEAFMICTQYVEGLSGPNQVVQKDIFEASLEYWKSKNMGYSDPQSWENMQTVLLDMGLLTGPLDLTKAYTNQFSSKK